MSRPEEDSTVPAATLLTQSEEVFGPDDRARSTLAPNMEIGRYRLVSRLGAGAMGEVWAATDPQLERDVAIKLVHPSLARDPEISARMVREARAMAKVSHRAVIAIHDAGEADGRLFLAMELVRGRTLGALLRGRGTEVGNWQHWLRVMIEAGRGLAAAHAAGVLHRDFKPDNVMVDERGRVCVGDFGLASLVDGPRAHLSRSMPATFDGDSELTTTGAMLGTPAYMSLEQMQGESVDARSDQFSFCVAIYEALYGKRPFAGNTHELAAIAELGDAIAAGHVIPAPAGTAVPATVRAIIVRGLAAKPGDRWPHLDAMLAELELELEPPRRPWRLIVAAAAVVVVAAAIAFVIAARHATVATAHALSPIPLRAGLALSSNGRLAIATDRLEVRDLASGRTWALKPPEPNRAWIEQLQFTDDNRVVRWADHSEPGVTWRWAFETETDAVREQDLGGTWLGATTEGDLVARPTTVDLTNAGKILRTWPREPGRFDAFTISPTRHRFAYLTTDRFVGRIIAADSTSGRSWQTTALVEPSGLGWLTDDTMLYGTADGSIFKVSLDDSGFGPPQRVYHLAAGWAGRMFVAAGHVRFVSHVPIARVRVIDRDSGRARDFEPSVAAAELGWVASGAFVTWNRASHVLEKHDGQATVTLAATLPSEPANATFAGDLLLASLRDVGGRKLVAVSMTTGAIAWQYPIGKGLAARCARDLEPPCFVALRTKDLAERYEIVALDPRTGATSGPPIYVGSLEDFAVHVDGNHLLMADGGFQVHEVDRSGAVTATFGEAMSSVRSIAYDPRGGAITSAIFGNSYAVALQDATHTTVLTQSDGELLSMVRPAPASGQILLLGRTIASELWELELPP